MRVRAGASAGLLSASHSDCTTEAPICAMPPLLVLLAVEQQMQVLGAREWDQGGRQKASLAKHPTLAQSSNASSRSAGSAAAAAATPASVSAAQLRSERRCSWGQQASPAMSSSLTSGMPFSTTAAVAGPGGRGGQGRAGLERKSPLCFLCHRQRTAGLLATIQDALHFRASLSHQLLSEGAPGSGERPPGQTAASHEIQRGSVRPPACLPVRPPAPSPARTSAYSSPLTRL